MAEWVRETVNYITTNGSADIHIMHNVDIKLYGSIDMHQAKRGDDELICHEDRIISPFRRSISYEENFNVYMAVKRQQYGKYRLCLVIFDLKNDSYVLVEAAINRIIRRFLTKMNDRYKFLVFKNLHNYLYMNNVDFNNEDF